ncbi:TRAP transporter small permease [Kocuria palustris]|uniref:TRAP transporter small permease n=1 Tax=Kocuria palustris TaxID=71999 RepID=UPI0011A0C96D|nr:TRAP transporter small permease [Kocuria palustris]
MSPLKRVIDAILATLCVVLFALLVIVVSWQVFTRQVLDSPSTWTSVAAQYLFVWLALFGSAYVFSDRGHIAVDFLARKAGAGGQRVIGVLTLAVVAAFAILVLIWGGIRATEISWTQQVSGIPVTVGQMYLALPISGALIVFYAVFHIVKILAGREAGLPIAEDDEIGRQTTANPQIASAPWQTRGMEVVEPVIPPGTTLPGGSSAVSPGSAAPADGTDTTKGR